MRFTLCVLHLFTLSWFVLIPTAVGRSRIDKVTSNQLTAMPGTGCDRVTMLCDTVNPANASASARISVPTNDSIELVRITNADSFYFLTINLHSLPGPFPATRSDYADTEESCDENT